MTTTEDNASGGSPRTPNSFTTEITENTEAGKPRTPEMDVLTGDIIGAAIKIHRVLGPGLLESAYEACLAYEIYKMGYKFERQKNLPLVYEEVRLDCGYRIDLMVENKIIIEVKSVSELAPIHESQLLCYLKLSGCKLGFLMNFNVKMMKDGVRRIII